MKADPKQVHVSKEYAHGAPLINCRFDPKGQHVFATAQDRAFKTAGAPADAIKVAKPTAPTTIQSPILNTPMCGAAFP